MWSTPLLAAAAVAAASGNQAPIVAVTAKTDEGETEGGEKVGGGSDSRGREQVTISEGEREREGAGQREGGERGRPPPTPPLSLSLVTCCCFGWNSGRLCCGSTSSSDSTHTWS